MRKKRLRFAELAERRLERSLTTLAKGTRSVREGITLLTILVLAGSASARVCSPRVVSPNNADAYSMRTFAQFPRWKDLTGNELAYEVYKYLADTRTGLFHMNEVLEEHDALSEYRTVRDPVKIINVYGYGYCGILGPVMAGIAEQIGLGPSRTITLPAWRHVAAETFYDGQWHYLDIDVRSAFLRPDGTLASMDDAKSDASLWTGPRGPLFFPHDPLDSTRKVYADTPVEHFYGFHCSGHTMDFVLRQGETFRRWWRPQGGRWRHAVEYNQLEWLRDLIEEEPRGPKPNHRDFTIHNHGNGRFIYAPDLTEGSSDFADGAYDFDNVATSAEGLTLSTAGEGYATFEVRSPYIIVPIVGSLDTTDDDQGACTVEIGGDKATVSISLDNGLTFEQIADISEKTYLDLTRYVSGTYGFLLKIGLRGEPNVAIVRSLKITTWVQVAPASLPSLRPGRNRMEFRTGDHRGLPTRVVEIKTNASDPNDFLRYVYKVPQDYDPGRQTSRVRGPLIVKVQAAPRTKISWLSIGASFQTYQKDEAKSTRNEMAYAVNEPRDFEVIYRANVPADQEHWHYNADREVILDKPADTVYVRYVGEPGVNNVCIYAHCIEDHSRPTNPVTISHVWTEKGTRKSHTVTLIEPGPFDITTGPDPVDEYIEMSISGRSE